MPHWGRKVLELRPVADIDKGTAVERLLGEGSVERALFGGDDRGDLDAFAALREMANAGRLRAAACVGVASHEAPPELTERADVVVDGPDGFLEVLRALAARGGRPLMLFVDLLRLTVLLIAGAASVLGLVTVIAADQNADYAVVYFSGVWWLIAAIGGISLGGSRRSGEAMGEGAVRGANVDLPPDRERRAHRLPAAVADRPLRDRRGRSSRSLAAGHRGRRRVRDPQRAWRGGDGSAR